MFFKELWPWCILWWTDYGTDTLFLIYFKRFRGISVFLLISKKTPPVEPTGSLLLLSLVAVFQCHSPCLSSTGASNLLLNLNSNAFFFRSIQMSWMQSSRGWVCLFVKKVLPEAVFLGKEREKSLTVHLVSITTAVHFSSPVALCVSFWMSKKDTKTIVHFWEICFHLIFWTHSKYHFRLFQSHNIVFTKSYRCPYMLCRCIKNMIISL